MGAVAGSGDCLARGWGHGNAGLSDAHPGVDGHCIPAFAQPKKGEWITDAKSGCKVWTSVPQLDYGISWSGNCRDGLATGRGVLQWFQAGKQLSHADCEMAEARSRVRTVVHYTNVNRYEGKFRDNRYHGHGALQYVNGMHYDGEFRHGLPNGHGTFTGNGETFAGNWNKGCFVGATDTSRSSRPWRHAASGDLDLRAVHPRHDLSQRRSHEVNGLQDHRAAARTHDIDLAKLALTPTVRPG